MFYGKMFCRMNNNDKETIRSVVIRFYNFLVKTTVSEGYNVQYNLYKKHIKKNNTHFGAIFLNLFTNSVWPYFTKFWKPWQVLEALTERESRCPTCGKDRGRGLPTRSMCYFGSMLTEYPNRSNLKSIYSSLKTLGYMRLIAMHFYIYF